MDHVFDPSQKQKLESEFRKKMLPKEPFTNFISSLKTQERNIAVEFEPGTGYFTVILAKYFHKVYGIEISTEMVEHLTNRLQDEGTKNVGLIVDREPQIDFEIDVVFFANVLHEVGDPNAYLDYPAKIIAVIDWKKGEQPTFGPPSDVRISEEKVIEMLESREYETEKIDAYEHHYFVVGRKTVKNA